MEAKENKRFILYFLSQGDVQPHPRKWSFSTHGGALEDQCCNNVRERERESVSVSVSVSLCVSVCVCVCVSVCLCPRNIPVVSLGQLNCGINEVHSP